MFLQVIVSVVMLHMVFQYSGEPEQKIIGFHYARSFDWLIFSIIMLLFLKLCFSLKRVEIQMNDDIQTTDKIIKRLKKFICLERVVITFYALSLIFFVVRIGQLTKQILDDEAISIDELNG